MSMWDEFAETTRESPDQLRGDLADYLVGDTLDRDMEGCQVVPRIVLLCESPHTDEVIHGHPLAGQSGLNVTTSLGESSSFDYPVCPASPIGCLVLRVRHRVLDGLGLMNVSRLPLQSGAYSCRLQISYSELIGRFEEIREEAQRKEGDSKLSMKIDSRPIWKTIGDDMCRRLAMLSAMAGTVEGGTEIVPCGAVARGYLRWAENRLGNLRPYGHKVCHPVKWGKTATQEEQKQIDVLVEHICGG